MSEQSVNPANAVGPLNTIETSDDTIRVVPSAEAQQGMTTSTPSNLPHNLPFVTPVPQHPIQQHNVPPTPSPLSVIQTPQIEPLRSTSQQPAEIHRQHQLQLEQLQPRYFFTSRYPYYVAVNGRINDPEFQWWLSIHGVNTMRERQRRTRLGPLGWNWEEYKRSEECWRDYINSR